MRRLVITADSSQFDPDFVHLDRVDIRRLSFPARLPHEFYYREDLPSPSVRNDSHATDQLKKERTTVKNAIMKLIRNTKAQDLVEYALMAGFVAVAAGAIMPNLASSISTIFSKVASVMSVASTQG